jgi:hypothetical protein
MGRDDFESQPLASGRDDWEDDIGEVSETVWEAQQRKPKMSKRRLFALFFAVLCTTNVLSGSMGIIIGRRWTDLDKACALHTTQYCEFEHLELGASVSANICKPLS